MPSGTRHNLWAEFVISYIEDMPLTITILRTFICLISIVAIAGCSRSDLKNDDGYKRKADTGLAGDTMDTSRKSVGLAEVRESLRRGDVHGGERILTEILLSEPENVEALELAGDIAASVRDPIKATSYFEEAVKLSEKLSEKPTEVLVDKLGAQWMMAGRPFKSIDTLRKAIAHYPDKSHFRQKIVGLMASVGLEREATTHARWLVQRKQGTVDLLIILSDLDRPQTIESTCEYALKTYPGDLRPAYALARKDVYAGPLGSSEGVSGKSCSAASRIFAGPSLLLAIGRRIG